MQEATGLRHCGRWVSVEQIEEIRETVRLCGGLSVTELAATVSEHLRWYTPAGGLKEDAAESLLRRLQASGLLELPVKRSQRRTAKPVELSARTAAQPPIEADLADLALVLLRAVKAQQEQALWNEYVERYHPLGYKRPIGYRMRYFIESGGRLLGCLLLAGAAKRIGVRDRWIGWSETERHQRLPWLVNNSRLLLFPWVRVKNLCSHVLGLLASGVEQDWEDRWGYRPVLIETFVDPLYEGVCYKAAGWQELGLTSGVGLRKRGRSYATHPRRLPVKPLRKDFRLILCSPLDGEGGSQDG